MTKEQAAKEAFPDVPPNKYLTEYVRKIQQQEMEFARGIFIKGWNACEANRPGMRWIKASERLPEAHKDIAIKYPDSDEQCLIIGSRMLIESFMSKGYVGIEWLDESADQLFTRKDMESAYNKGGDDGLDWHNGTGSPTFTDFMNTNYPNQK